MFSKLLLIQQKCNFPHENFSHVFDIDFPHYLEGGIIKEVTIPILLQNPNFIFQGHNKQPP